MQILADKIIFIKKIYENILYYNARIIFRRHAHIFLR